MSLLFKKWWKKKNKWYLSYCSRKHVTLLSSNSI